MAAGWVKCWLFICYPASAQGCLSPMSLFLFMSLGEGQLSVMLFHLPATLPLLQSPIWMLLDVPVSHHGTRQRKEKLTVLHEGGSSSLISYPCVFQWNLLIDYNILWRKAKEVRSLICHIHTVCLPFAMILQSIGFFGNIQEQIVPALCINRGSIGSPMNCFVILWSPMPMFWSVSLYSRLILTSRCMSLPFF